MRIAARGDEADDLVAAEDRLSRHRIGVVGLDQERHEPARRRRLALGGSAASLPMKSFFFHEMNRSSPVSAGV